MCHFLFYRKDVILVLNGSHPFTDLKQYSFDEELRSGIYPDFTIRPANELENR